MLPSALAMPHADLVIKPRQNPGQEWIVIGDSWASGVTYNRNNQYDSQEICMRTTEAWGAHMEADESWTDGEAKFNFAACGGTLMKDAPRQALCCRLACGPRGR